MNAVPREIDADSGLPPHLVALFLKTAPPQMLELCAACQRRDTEGATAIAHKLKGSLYAAGASRLAETLEELRLCLSGGRWADADRLVADAQQRFARVLAELRGSNGA